MKIFLLIALLTVVGTIIGSKFSCDKEYKNFRSGYKKVVKNDGVLFLIVSFVQIGQNSFDSEGVPTIKTHLSNIRIPLLFYPTNTGDLINNYCLSYVSQTKANYNWCNFNPYPETQKEYYSSSQCTQKDEQLKAYFFTSPKIEVFVAPEKFAFKACRMFIDSEKQMRVEKSFLILNHYMPEDELLNNEDDLEQELTNATFDVLNYPEFQDKDFCVCNHMISYFNECPELKKNSDIISIIVIALSFLVGFTFGRIWLFISSDH